MFASRFTLEGAYWRQMPTSHGPKRSHLASSPFAPEPELEIEVFEVDDRVCHDLYGMGKVIRVDSHAVTVDFGSQAVRIKPPFAKMQHL